MRKAGTVLIGLGLIVLMAALIGRPVSYSHTVFVLTAFQGILPMAALTWIAAGLYQRTRHKVALVAVVAVATVIVVAAIGFAAASGVLMALVHLGGALIGAGTSLVLSGFRRKK